VRAALDLAGEEGPEAVSLARLADRLGLPTATVHRCFASKGALLAELQSGVVGALARATEDGVAEAERRTADEAMTTQERALLAIVVSALVFERFARDAPAELAILATALAPSEALASERDAPEQERAAAATAPALADLVGRLRDAERLGAIARGDAGERAVGLWAGLQGVARTRLLSGDGARRIDATRVSEGLISALLLGWGADRETTSRLIERARRERFADTTATTLAHPVRMEKAAPH
jgi:AcrR family transcriptional regulator